MAAAQVAAERAVHRGRGLPDLRRPRLCLWAVLLRAEGQELPARAALRHRGKPLAGTAVAIQPQQVRRRDQGAVEIGYFDYLVTWAK